MKANYKLAVALLAGAAMGMGGASAIRARQLQTAPGYVIAEVEVTDPAGMQKYGAQVPGTLAPFNHHYVVRTDKAQSLEGEPPKGIVIIAFDSVEKAREWYDSTAYQAIKPLRQNATKSRLFLAEGVAAQ